MVAEIAFKGYSAFDLNLSRGFYEAILGLWAITVVWPVGEGLVEHDVGPGSLSITNRPPLLKPSECGGLAVLEVSNIAECTATLGARGLLLAVPLTEGLPCIFAMIHNPDGDFIGLYQRKK